MSNNHSGIVLRVEGVSKHYGKLQALRSVSFEVPEKSVFGILGPNGSGKTTLLGILLGVLQPTAGSFEWFGQAPAAALRRRIGSLLETPNFYEYLSAYDNLLLRSKVHGRGSKQEIEAVLRQVGLYAWRHRPIKKYSLGMKQRAAIAAALLGRPKVLILDEPTNGLDPVGIAEVRALILQLREEGYTIIMASHLLDEVQKVCTHTAILKSGQLLACGEVGSILSGMEAIEIGAEEPERLQALLKSHYPEAALRPQERGWILEVPQGSLNPADLNRLCFENGIVLTHLRVQPPSLEKKFLEITQNQTVEQV